MSSNPERQTDSGHGAAEGAAAGSAATGSSLLSGPLVGWLATLLTVAWLALPLMGFFHLATALTDPAQTAEGPVRGVLSVEAVLFSPRGALLLALILFAGIISRRFDPRRASTDGRPTVYSSQTGTQTP